MTKKKKLEIRVEFTVKGIDIEKATEDDYVEDYVTSLTREIAEYYPEADIMVKKSDRDRVYIPSDNLLLSQSVGADVQAIIANHWPEWLESVLT